MALDLRPQCPPALVPARARLRNSNPTEVPAAKNRGAATVSEPHPLLHGE